MRRLTLLLCCLLLTASGCTRWFFYPMQPLVAKPTDLGYDYRDVFLEADDGTGLHAWLLEPKGPPVGTVYFLHGNAENISTHFRATLWLIDSGYEVLALDYRGYGLSQGKPDIPEVYDDIEAGARWIVDHVAVDSGQQRPVFLYGQSLGASLAITFASRSETFRENFNGLISEAAFPRFGTIARHVAAQSWLTWSAQYLAQWMIGSRHDPLDAIKRLEGVPKLLVHSRDDSIIPYEFGRKLYEAAPEPRQWITADGPHIMAIVDPQVRQAMLDFMQRYARPENVPARSPSDSRTGR